ncbi:MAG: dTMP kinase [Gammaproteobacteria bacterium 39-13]|nr:dTMP kinase [Gammaproteobacteria bacterium]OJV91840.1 MAG: dTMP kinase [Gammaproteobacteria bacterium 39-13]
MSTTVQKGKFITIEGIEGVGKSSNVNLIADLIQKAGNQVVVTREPGGTPIAEAIRKVLLAEYDEEIFGQTELLLLYAARIQHVEHVIKPALAEGKWVVCDRFVDATYAYQGAGRGIPIEKIDSLHQWALGDFVPDCTIILDASPEIAFERIKKNRDLDRFEKEKIFFFQRIRQQYLQIAGRDKQRYRIVDASRPLKDVQDIIRGIIVNIF